MGNTRTDGALFATTATGSSGPVFFLAGPAWTSLVNAFSQGGELPADVFAPGPDPERRVQSRRVITRQPSTEEGGRLGDGRDLALQY